LYNSVKVKYDVYVSLSMFNMQIIAKLLEDQEPEADGFTMRKIFSRFAFTV